MRIGYHENTVTVEGCGSFALEQTLDCGQAFRWRKNDDGSWAGVAFGRELTIRKGEEGQIVLSQCSSEEFQAIWRGYFDLDTDYDALKARFCADPVLQEACRFAWGMRVLRQQPWEALCSFIFSQNNNIPRIKGIVERFCAGFGEPVRPGIYAFPTPERVAVLTLDALGGIRAGFRAKYVLDAAQKVAAGEVNLEALRGMEYGQARQELMKIKGVGPKVADCALLYGLTRIDAVPMDVWMKRVMERYYPSGFPEEITPFGGIAQQYLFHYIRHLAE